MRMGVSGGLDAGFEPAAVWERDFRNAVATRDDRVPLVVACERRDGSGTSMRSEVCVRSSQDLAAAVRHAERRVKFLLWACGGSVLHVGGPVQVFEHLRRVYSRTGARAFDVDVMNSVFGSLLEVRHHASVDDAPELSEDARPRGRNLKGCRIGFDLGGSDRKSAAVIDGNVVFSDETPWNPYFEKDPEYHIGGIQESLERAAAHLPRVDAIGGSAAGIYVNNEVRIASLFRGVPIEAFNRQIRPIFQRLQEAWGVPVEVANDGDVTALAGSMALGRNAILGISMGTSVAAGYVNRSGFLTPRLSELAFAPVDYRLDAPVDEWSGDAGCGVQYFSQQAVARLAPAAGLEFEPAMPLAERLLAVQEMHENGDACAAAIFQTIGMYLGYSIPLWRTYFDFDTVLLLGRVTSGRGGDVIIDAARHVLSHEFRELSDVEIVTPDERQKRHGQAIAAASLPKLRA